MDHPTNGPTPGPDASSGADPVMAELVDALSRAGTELAARPVPEEAAEQHLAAITTAAAAHAHTSPATAVTAAAAPTWGARVRRVLGLTGVKVALGAGVAAAATGGLAAGGNLPDPVQTVISDGAAWFGVDLPSPERPDPGPELPDEANSEAEDAVSEAPVPDDGVDVPTPAPGPPFTDVPPSEVVPTEVPRPEITPPGGPPPGTTPSDVPPSDPPPRDDPPRDDPPRDDSPASGEAPDHAGASDPNESPADEGAGGSDNRGGPLIGTTQAAVGSSSVPTTGRTATR